MLQTVISKCGDSLKLSDDVLNDLQSFVIGYIYGDTQSSTLNQACMCNQVEKSKEEIFDTFTTSVSCHFGILALPNFPRTLQYYRLSPSS